MLWTQSWRADPKARALADRHYNRQKVGAPQFVPPGRCLVLYCRTDAGEALWVTSWPFAEFVKHEWAGAWICSIFRNEGAAPASWLIREAVAATREFFGEPPEQGLVTFVDRREVKPFVIPSGKRQGEEIFGQTFRQAGFRECGETAGGLLALQLLPARMPRPMAAAGSLFSEAC